MEKEREPYKLEMMEHLPRDELQRVIRLIDEVYTRFGFTYSVELSAKPEDCVGMPLKT